MAGHCKVCSCFCKVARLAVLVCLLLGVSPCHGQGQSTYNSTDVLPDGSCRGPAQTFCRGVKFGDARVANCLRAKLRVSSNPVPGGSFFDVKTANCKLEVTRFFKAVSQKRVPAFHNHSFIPVDVVPGFRKACLADVLKFCTRKTDESSVPCLKRHTQKLKQSCKSALLRVKIEEARNMNLDKPFHDACKADIDSLPQCRDIPEDSHLGQKKSCLKRHRGSLSSKCRKQLFVKEKEDAKDLRLNVEIHERCRYEEKIFCSETPFGEARMIKCLWDSRNKMDFGPTCRHKVELLMQRTMQNYQLDYRFTLFCESEISLLCGDEKARLDNASETDRKALAGTVFACLKKKFSEVKHRDCQVELHRVVRVHAQSAKTDPLFHSKCFADLGVFCEDSGNVSFVQHTCLRNHLDELSEECRDYELLQGSLEARDISMKPALEKACVIAIRNFCKDVPHGDAQVIRCLQDHRYDSGFPTHCADVVQEDLEASNHDLRLKFGISGLCRQDAHMLCSDRIVNYGGVGLIGCLKSQYLKVDNSGCRQELRRFFAHGSQNIMAAPDTYDACVGDVEFFCSNVNPGQGRVHECLINHKDELTEMCQIAEFEQLALQSMDITLSPTTMRVCKTKMTEFCPEVMKTDGSMWKCLEDHKSKMSTNDKCRKAVLAHELRTNSEFHLNPILVEHCTEDAQILCKKELEYADSKDFHSDGGVISCLIDNRAKISAEVCREGMLEKQRQRLENIQNDPDASKACRDDIIIYCSDGHGHVLHQTPVSAVGAVHTCLQNHLANLTAPCKKTEQMYMEMKSENIKLAPRLRKACSQETSLFCRGIEAGLGRVLDCLMDHMHNQDMGRVCQKKLLNIQEKRATNRAISAGLSRNCVDDFKLLVSSDKCKRLTKRLGKKALLKVKGLMGATAQAMAGQGPLDCLVNNRDNVNGSSCLRAIYNELRRQSNDLRAKPGMWEACKDDVHRLCPNITFGSGRLHRCLRDKSQNISSEKCLEMVIAVKRVEGEDVTINPVLRKECAHEISSFCKGVPHGNQRLFTCLGMYKEDNGFSDVCKKALITSMGKEMFESVREAGYEKKKIMSAKGMLKWLKKNSHLQPSSGGMIAGMVIGAIFALAIVGLCMWVVTKKLKGGYSVMVPRNLQA